MLRLLTPPPPPSIPPHLTDFSPTAHAVAVNILWFMSLILSLSCALAATLVQQWVRTYMRDVKSSRSTSIRGLRHLFLCLAVERFRLDEVPGTIVTLLHLSVGLFLTGLIIFLFPINHIVAGGAIAAIAITGFVYIALTIVPLVIPECPYSTPLTPVLGSIPRAAVFLFLTSRNLVFVIKDFKEQQRVQRRMAPSAKWFSKYIPTRQSSLSKLSLSATFLQHAIQRTLVHVDELHDLGLLFEGLADFLNIRKKGAASHDELSLLNYLAKSERNFFGLINLYISQLERELSSRNLPDPGLIRRFSSALAVGRILVQGLVMHDTQRVVKAWNNVKAWSSVNADMRGHSPQASNAIRPDRPDRELIKFLRWSGSSRSTSLVIRSHRANLRSSAFRLLADRVDDPGMEGIAKAGRIILHLARTPAKLIPLHDCVEWDGLVSDTSSLPQSSDIRYWIVCNAFDFLRVTLHQTLEVIDAYSGVWTTCLDDMESHRSPTLPIHPASVRVSQEVWALFKHAGVLPWLSPGGDTTSEPGNARHADALRRYPKLHRAMRTLAMSVQSISHPSEIGEPLPSSPFSPTATSVPSHIMHNTSPTSPVNREPSDRLPGAWPPSQHDATMPRTQLTSSAPGDASSESYPLQLLLSSPNSVATPVRPSFVNEATVMPPNEVALREVVVDNCHNSGSAN
ncbi:hypothetical protein K488DRAFT_89804 [Vararia minispora EC-137]|uniref:Uncharacterized protein n=1 Tax=Vararia minispora EC-137 TaxID=1314806 RepID=A0ACB8Q9I5_9AGAM|nr:hypothetical protein K488DRAFT_89804 [Vararia minispora EC-137]